RKLGEALLQLLLVIVRGGVLDLRLDLGDAAFDVGFLSGAVDDRGVFLLDAHPLGAAEHLDRHVLELDAEVLGNQRAAAEDCKILEHRLRRSPKPGALTAATLRPPRSLLTTSVARTSPSTSSATISSGRLLCTTDSSTGSIAWRPDSFFSKIRM